MRDGGFGRRLFLCLAWSLPRAYVAELQLCRKTAKSADFAACPPIIGEVN